MTEKQITYAGAALAYRVAGNGRPVMLVHGFGEDSRIWDRQAEALSSVYRLILPDLPGSGRSGLIPDMRIEGMAGALKAIWEAENSGEQGFVLVGHSMGGYIALAFAEKYGDCLLGLGLFHSTAYPDNAQKIETRRKGIAFIRDHGGPAFLKTVTPNLFSPGFREVSPETVQQLIDRGNNFSGETLVLYYEAMIARPDRTELLKTIKKPVLFVIGKYDGAVAPEDVYQQCHLPERSYIHTLYRSGHMGMLEEPGLSDRILENFIRETA